MMKKSPLATVVVALLANRVSISKLEVVAPVPYLTILVIVAPVSVLVKEVAAVPVACAVVRVMLPALLRVAAVVAVMAPLPLCVI
jgi:hypothetical protein